MNHGPHRERSFRIAVRKFGPFEQAIAAQWAAFEAEARTGLTLEAVPMELHDLQQALLGPHGMRTPAWDVAFLATDWIAAMHAQNAAVDLAPLIARTPPPGYPNAWSDSLLRLQRVGDAILGVPYHDGPECLMYRRDLFDDPVHRRRFYQRFHRPLGPPTTWADFHRIAQFFHNPAERLFGTAFAAFPDGHNSVYDFLLQLWTRNGELFSPSGKLRFNTPQAQEALTFYRTLLHDSTAIHPDSASLDSVAAGMRFAAGEVALMVNWFGFAVHAHTSPDSSVRGRIDIADIPSTPPSPSASLNVYWILALAAGSPHRELAWRFLRHTQFPAMDLLTTTHGAIGCRKSTWADPAINAQIPFYSRMESVHRNAREIPQREDWPQIASIIDSLMSATIATTAPIASLLARADEEAAALSPQWAFR